MTSWFISDLHLRDTFELNGQTLLRFLFELNKVPRENRLFLLGDIFDVWVSDGAVFQKKFKLIIDEIVRFKQGGGEVYYFEGNHDVHLDVFWTKKYGIQVFDKEQYFDLDGLYVRVEHGDYINPHDTTYLKWIETLRGPGMRFIGDVVPGHLWEWAAQKYSQKSRKKTSRYSSEFSEKIRGLIREYAENCFSKKHFDVIVTGHMHVFDDYEFKSAGQSVRSVNLGTWLEKPRALKIVNRKVEVVELLSYLQN